ncbi:related to cell cycle control protein cwf15 [Sporisorium reilianum f. sp. reilianum]|uniref:Related to cell cycle control protein cwf15 n=1 Tax=Sporisorium reilianum f. sp. reilianum TaxID=72559 RepID=A0A2N8UJN0_9BASI|nr:related to cell cycle control protein cwf15 [Sporisorium reilianum f. sp. reilianum]
MSTAHRPNFSAAKARAPGTRQSEQTSIANIPQHTKLKFRQPVASTSTSAPAAAAIRSASGSGGEAARRRDLKRELELAEWEASNRKRQRDGLEALPMPGSGAGEEEEEARRRREAIAQAIELDRESDASSAASSDEDDEEEKPNNPTSKDDDSDDDDAHSSDSASDSATDSESEDEQTLLLRELEKIKAERAAEKQRLAALASSSATASEHDEIARGNPLLNLQNAFSSSSTPSTSKNDAPEFGVKKRWDHDVIFKNQAEAAGNGSAKGGFVNDLTRSEFHKKFINRYIK